MSKIIDTAKEKSALQASIAHGVSQLHVAGCDVGMKENPAATKLLSETKVSQPGFGQSLGQGSSPSPV